MDNELGRYQAIYRLIKSNADKTFLFTYGDHTIVEVSYELEFDDNPYSTDTNLIDDSVSYKSVAMTVKAIRKDEDKLYSVGDMVVVSPLGYPDDISVL